ncbi:MAG: hypothetical protein O7I93_18510 [Gemmatimonadetes bacterium]|nr:hypothetical protein [Gemmatimonadota bacterium]
MKLYRLTGLALLVPLSMAGQQVSDDDFRFANANPAFASNQGPRVCIDEGHHNFHTADGRYKPFADLLRGDGYTVAGFSGAFTDEDLAGCGLLVIANPLAEENVTDWSYPHPSAFAKEEIRELMVWIRAGGRLLLFADHAPIAGAARDLGAVLGLVMIDAYVDAVPGATDVFQVSDGTLRPHRILEGRAPFERVNSVTTFTGQAVQITGGWTPLFVFGPEAVARISLSQVFQDGAFAEWPQFPVGGWVHGAVREWDRGRMVFLGEAAMCSAQVSGEERYPMGMNHPEAPQNAQFCLSVVRWLTGVLDR